MRPRLILEDLKDETKISENFTFKELYSSDIARLKNIDNTIKSQDIIDNLIKVIEKIVQPARTAISVPITITSAYRCHALNSAVKGSSNSQHLTGHAVDLHCDDTFKLFHWIRSNCEYDQLIWEFGYAKPQWVHVSYVDGKNRNQILYIH